MIRSCAVSWITTQSRKTVKCRNGFLRTHHRVLLVAAIMLLIFLGISSAFADSIETSHIAMRKGETLTVSCTSLAIESVYVHGNLSQIELDFPKMYPTSEISFKAMNLGNLDLTITFQHSGDYRISVSILDTLGGLRDVDNYYLSNGSFTVKIMASIAASPANAAQLQRFSPQDFSNWMARFGEAFPLWTKLLYLFLGFQFLFVGYERITFDDKIRQERRLRPLDRGNKIYISVDVLCRFLLSCLAITAALMVGQVILLMILSYFLLVTIELPSIWNLFVLAFGAAVTILVYLLRTVLRHKFEFAPAGFD